MALAAFMPRFQKEKRSMPHGAARRHPLLAMLT
jgi:hypothetical protein